MPARLRQGTEKRAMIEGVSNNEVVWALFSMAFMIVMPAFIGWWMWRKMKKDAEKESA
jgi:hypothetical protein